MSTISKQDLSCLIFEAMNKRDFNGLEQHIVEDVALDFPGAGRIEGYKRVIIFIKALLRKYSELTFSINEVIVEKDRACTVWTNIGITTAGADYVNSGITLFYFSDNRITFISDFTLGLNKLQK